MDSTFRDMIVEGWLIIYMDDILVFAETLEECQRRTKWVLDRMKEEDLHLKLAKCTFNQTVLRPRERNNNYYNYPLVVTWTGDTHEETDVLPDNRLETRGDNKQDILLDKEKLT